MPNASASTNKALPQSYYLCYGSNTTTLRQCIRDAQRAARSPDAPPTERHLHRIIASAGLESLHHIKSCQAAPAQRAERLVNNAIRQLETIRVEAAL